MKQKIIAQGAEAIIYLKNNLVTKDRVKKSYRIPELDEKIRKLRTRGEAKLLKKVSTLINIPKNIKEDEKTKKIIMDYIDGEKLSDNLDNFPLKKQKDVCKQIGCLALDLADLQDRICRNTPGLGTT